MTLDTRAAAKPHAAALGPTAGFVGPLVIALMMAAPTNAQVAARDLAPTRVARATEPKTTLPAAAAPALAAPAAAAARHTAPAPAMALGEGIRVLALPAGETTLSSPTVGRLIHLEATIGQGFAAGAVLARFECDEPQARLAMAEADLSSAVEQHEAKVRLQGLDQASDVEVALAASAVAKGRGQIAMTRAQIAQCAVRAPWAGRIAKVHVRNHMAVAPSTPMLDLVRTGQLKLKLNVPSKWLPDMKVGRVFSVKIDETGADYEARVTAVNSRVDAVSQTIELEAQMARVYEGLLPGMSGTALFDAPAAQAKLTR